MEEGTQTEKESIDVETTFPERQVSATSSRKDEQDRIHSEGPVSGRKDDKNCVQRTKNNQAVPFCFRNFTPTAFVAAVATKLYECNLELAISVEVNKPRLYDSKGLYFTLQGYCGEKHNFL